MIINGQEININDLYDQKYMHKEISKGIFLSEYQIDVIKRYGIDLTKIVNLNDLIFKLNEILDEDPDAEELEIVSNQISEFNYYANTNK